MVHDFDARMARLKPQREKQVSVLLLQFTLMAHSFYACDSWSLHLDGRLAHLQQAVHATSTAHTERAKDACPGGVPYGYPPSGRWNEGAL